MTGAKSKAKQRVAIVGSGMAGLATAHLLHNDPHQRYSVTVFESVRISLVSPFAGLTRAY
jgi:2-polyprenyl-6-methoxyphenol hydroxylase-like FAD-dependent oxidoreductase